MIPRLQALHALAARRGDGLLPELLASDTDPQVPRAQPSDPSGLTANAAASMMFEILCSIAEDVTGRKRRTP
jgi:hypothetical protein